MGHYLPAGALELHGPEGDQQQYVPAQEDEAELERPIGPQHPVLVVTQEVILKRSLGHEFPTGLCLQLPEAGTLLV